MIEDDLDTLPDDVDVDDVKDFNPRKSDRPPRSIGFAEETEHIFTHLRNRGDQRIGQYLINVVRSETDVKTGEDIEQKLWGIEADRLLELIKRYESDDDEENRETECVACGDGADSADELQEILEEKGGE